MVVMSRGGFDLLSRTEEEAFSWNVVKNARLHSTIDTVNKEAELLSWHVSTATP